ncbi:hypothetical protein [Dechloromonas sp. ZS-1]|uniref:hypothetical protein n=1 Tax=Dechloromonas sp. ZS-1 TaxID=3138067 RepID=UPI0031FDBD08
MPDLCNKAFLGWVVAVLVAILRCYSVVTMARMMVVGWYVSLSILALYDFFSSNGAVSADVMMLLGAVFFSPTDLLGRNSDACQFESKEVSNFKATGEWGEYGYRK